MKIEFNKKTENPFAGMRNCLNLFSGNVSSAILDECYQEVKGSREKKEMFYSLLFSIGDITNREHNIFHHNKVDNGGRSDREAFYLIMDWIMKNDYAQFVKFLKAGLFNEYTCFDNLFRNRVTTYKNTTSVNTVYTMFSRSEYRHDLAVYVASIVRGNNPFNKMLVAKFLTLPRLGKRSGHKQMLPQTRKVMLDKCKFLAELSDMLGWEYRLAENYANFSGYRNWRKEYNQELESVLFSSGKIREFDKEEFLKWLNSLPSQARFRVRNRVCFPRDNAFKYPNLKAWYAEWEKYKEEKQYEQRVLEEKVRQNTASEEDLVKLKEVKKEAKVTVGATSFKDLYDDILNGTIDPLKLESFGNKVHLDYNTLVIVDDSGSMRGAPFNFAQFLASVCLVKNPDDAGRSLIGMFNTKARLYKDIDSYTQVAPNAFMRNSIITCAPERFVKPEYSLYDNYKRISSFLQSKFEGGGTHINSIPKYFQRLAEDNPQILDDLKNYPIWTIISDGEWNNLRSPEASLNEFFMNCESFLGYRPFVIAIDIDTYGWSSRTTDRFTGIDNFMYIPSRPEMIEQILTNFKDMDRFDAYTPLQSIYRSNRYDIVRKNVL